MTLIVTVDTILIRDSEPAFVDYDDEVVLLSVANGAYFSLNATASRIWNMLVEPRRVGEISEILAEACDGDRDIIIEDTISFLGELLERRLVKIIRSDAPA